MLVAGESSVHLEAVLCNIQSLYFTGGRPPKDVYGYQENGLLDGHIESVQDLSGAVREALGFVGSIRHRARYYIDTVDSVYDGRSTQAVAKIVQQISARGAVSLEGWSRVESEKFPEVWRAGRSRY